MPRIPCHVRWLASEPQPGWVEYLFTDAAGLEVRFEDKPIWTDALVPESGEPVAALFPVHVLGSSVVNGVQCSTVELDADAISFPVPASVLVW